MRWLLLLAAMMAVVLAVTVPALGQVSGGNNSNIIVCVNTAAQYAQAAVDANEDAEATLLNLIDQLNLCVISDDDTTINNEYTTINNKNVTQESDQEAESGNIDATADVNNWGDNAALCVPIMQSSNTGNDQTGQQFAQSDTTADHIEPGGNTSELDSEMSDECAPAVNQPAGS